MMHGKEAKVGSNGKTDTNGKVAQKKFQMHLQSSLGPIYVMLVNSEYAAKEVDKTVVHSTEAKEAPKESEKAELDASKSSKATPKAVETPKAQGTKAQPAPATPPSTRSTRLRNPPVNKDMIPTMSISSRGRGRKHSLTGRSGPGRPPKQAKVKEEEEEEEEAEVKPVIMESALPELDDEIMEELIGADVLAPMLRLSPPPSQRDYLFDLGESEGVSDLFDLFPSTSISQDNSQAKVAAI